MHRSRMHTRHTVFKSALLCASGAVCNIKEFMHLKTGHEHARARWQLPRHLKQRLRQRCGLRSNACRKQTKDVYASTNAAMCLRRLSFRQHFLNAVFTDHVLTFLRSFSLLFAASSGSWQSQSVAQNGQYSGIV